MKALIALVTAGLIAIVAIASFLHVTTAQREARLKELRATAPQTYLAELKAASDARWESELQALDRPAYEKLLADREAARRDRVLALRRELKTVQSSDLDRQYEILDELSKLEPADQEITSKKTSIIRKREAALEEQRQKEAQLEDEKRKKKKIADELWDMCYRVVKMSLQYLSTFDYDYGREDYDNAVSFDFEAKNGFGAVLPHRATCWFNKKTGALLDFRIAKR
jgi:hypothetical protein